jgi:hypothetical protein
MSQLVANGIQFVANVKVKNTITWKSKDGERRSLSSSVGHSAGVFADHRVTAFNVLGSISSTCLRAALTSLFIYFLRSEKKAG